MVKARRRSGHNSLSWRAAMGPYLKRGRSTTLVRCPGRLGLSIVGSRTSLEKATHMPNHEFRRQSADRPAELWPSLNGRSSSPRGRTAPDRRVAAKTRCPHTIIPSYQGVRGDIRPGHNEDSRFQVYSVDRGGGRTSLVTSTISCPDRVSKPGKAGHQSSGAHRVCF